MIDYDEVKNVLHKLNTDDTIASAHGILCGFACVKPNLKLDNWLNEVLISIDLNNVEEKIAHEQLTKIFNITLLQLNDTTLNFHPFIANENAQLQEQANTLIQWCGGFLVGLGLQKISTTDKDLLEMIKDFGEISKLNGDIPDDEQNTRDLNEIIEFVRMGTLFIRETLQTL